MATIDSPAENTEAISQTVDIEKEDSSEVMKPQVSASPQFKWWSQIHEYRIRVDVDPSTGTHLNAPIQFFINFTEILWDNGVTSHVPSLNQDRVNTKDILVVEQTTSGAGTVYPVQYDPRGTTYDQGDIVWIINKNFESVTLNFFIYIILGPTDALTNPVTQKSTSRNSTYYPFRLFYESFDYQNGIEPDTQLGLVNIGGQTGAGGNVAYDNYFDNTIEGRNGLGAYAQTGNIWRGQTIPGGISCSQYSTLYLTFSMYVYDNVYDSQYTYFDIIGTDLQDSATAPTSSTRRGIYAYGRQSWTGVPTGFINERRISKTWHYHDWNLKVDLPTGSTAYTTQTLARVVYELDDDSDVGYSYPRYYTNYPVTWDDVAIWNTTVQMNSQYSRPIPTVVDFDKISSNFNMRVLDLDGFPVPNAQVYIKHTTPSFNQQGTTGDAGTISFGSVAIGQTYDVIVNYTTTGVSPSQTFTIATIDDVLLNSFNFNLTVNTNIWSMDFKIKDYDGVSFSKGFVVLYNNSVNQEPIVNGTLDENGEVTLRYINSSSSFNYSVFYNTNLLGSNYIYKENAIKIANGLVTRTFIDEPELITHSVVISQGTGTFLTGGSYPGNFTAFAPPSSYYVQMNLSQGFFNNKKFGYLKTELSDFSTQILFYSIQGILSDNTEPVVATDSGSLGTAETIEVDGYEMKSAILFIQRDNANTNWKINISYYLRTTVNVVANITTINFNIKAVTADPVWGQPLETEPFASAICRFRNGSNSVSIANITSDSNGEVEFTYLRYTPETYNNITLKISFVGSDQPMNKTDMPIGGNPGINWTTAMNFTTNTAQTRDVLIAFFDTNYETKLECNTTGPLTFSWGDTRTIEVNFTYSTDGNIFTPINADAVTFAIRDAEYDLYLSGTLTPYATGKYRLNLDTGDLLGGKTYALTFSVSKTGYPAPETMPDPISLTVNKLATTYHLYDQATGLEIINNQIVEKKWGEVFNLTVVYQYQSTYLSGAYVAAEWQYESSRVMYEQSGFGGIINYTLPINTTAASSLGTYFIQLVIDLQNYTGHSMYFQLQILPIPTSLNSSSSNPTADLLRISITLNQTDVYLFNFTFRDTFNLLDLANATTEYTYDYITGAENGIGTLDTLNNGYLYQLNFSTDTRDVGNYILLVTIRKTNYEQRQALIFLTIQRRNIDYQLQGDFSGLQVSKVKGDQWLLAVKLRDMSRGFIPLTGAAVSLSFSSAGYIFNLLYTSNGIYSTTATWDSLKTIFTGSNYQGQLIISKSTYNTISLGITLLIADRVMDISFSGDFNGKTEVSKVKGNDFIFEIKLVDSKTGAIIENAQPKLIITSKNMEIALTYVGDGVYRATETFENIDAFVRDDSFQAVLVIDLENYANIRESITITIKMEEVAEGIPMFYLIIVIGAAALLIGTIGGYKAIQQARIPAYVKLIDKTSKTIASKKEIGLERIAMSERQEMVAKFGDRWKLLGLDLGEIIGAGKEKAITGENIAPGDEEGGE